MTLFAQAIAWILSPAHWADNATGPGLGSQIRDHVVLSLLSLLVIAAIALPLGLFIGHTGRGRALALVSTNASRALPTLGILSVAVVALNIGLIAPLLALALLGIPPLLAGAYAGLESVDRQVIDAARAVGMTEWQVLAKVELPLAAPLILGGLRSATLQVVATAALASQFGFDSIGTSILGGLASGDYVQMIAGALLVTVLALVLDGLYAVVQRFAEPRGVPQRSGVRSTARGRRTLPTAPTGAPLPEGN